MNHMYMLCEQCDGVCLCSKVRTDCQLLRDTYIQIDIANDSFVDNCYTHDRKETHLFVIFHSFGSPCSQTDANWPIPHYGILFS